MTSPAGGVDPAGTQALLRTIADQQVELAELRREVEDLRSRLREAGGDDDGGDLWRRLGLTEGERRTVTVLFADVSGFTTMAEGLDPEDCTAIMRDTLRGLAKVITDHGGHVEKFIGDAVCALFGAPVAYEDEPQRAAEAALDMHALMDRFASLRPHLPALTIHIGINTGSVIAGEIGDGSQYGVMGDTINTAARLMDAASSRQTFVSAATAARLRAGFRLEPAGTQTLKGKKQAVVAYELVGRGTPLPDTVETPFVGRVPELERVVSADRPRVVVVTGPPGIGKSRLLAEAAAAASQASAVAVATARTHGARPGQVLADALETVIATLPDSDTKQQCMGFLDETFDHLPPEFEAALAEALRDAAARRPIAIFLDGYEQADPGSVALLPYLVHETEGAPVTWTVAGRETAPAIVELLDRTASVAETLPLPPLEPADTERLLDELLPGALEPTVRAHLARVAAGSPEYCGELVRAMIDQELVVPMGETWERVGDIATLETPETLRELIEARLERLDTASRRVLQAASVIGVRFSLELLRHTADEPAFVVAALDELQRLQIVLPPDDDSEGYYAFRTPLLRTVVYESVLRRRRPEYHRRAGDGLLAMHPEDAETLAEMLGFHYEEAGEHERAAHHLGIAADRAYAGHAFRAAADLVGRCLDALDVSAPDDPRLHVLRLRRAEDLILAGDPDGAGKELAAVDRSRLDDDRARRAAWVALLVAASDPGAPVPVLPDPAEVTGAEGAIVDAVVRLREGDARAAQERAVAGAAAALDDGDYLLGLLGEELAATALGDLGAGPELAAATDALETKALARGDEAGCRRAQDLRGGADQEAGPYRRLLGGGRS